MLRHLHIYHISNRIYLGISIFIIPVFGDVQASPYLYQQPDMLGISIFIIPVFGEFLASPYLYQQPDMFKHFNIYYASSRTCLGIPIFIIPATEYVGTSPYSLYQQPGMFRHHHIYYTSNRRYLSISIFIIPAIGDISASPFYYTCNSRCFGQYVHPFIIICKRFSTTKQARVLICYNKDVHEKVK